MTDHGPDGLRDAAAERLLEAVTARRLRADDALSRLLLAASAPGQPDELRGREAALAAFRAAAPTSQAGRHVAPRRSALRRFMTVKIAVIVGAATLGGVALASGVGVLPNPLAPSPSGVPSLTTSESPLGTGEQPTAHPTPDPNPSHSVAPVPTTGLLGLCHAYDRDPEKTSGKALDNPAYAALISAAGGREQVEALCADLLVGKTTTPSSVKTSKARPSESVPTR
jgi:hypothetical protein